MPELKTLNYELRIQNIEPVPSVRKGWERKKYGEVMFS